MQLKELTLKELLALFDASTHDQISSYYQDPAVHHIVVFANHFQPDMGLLTVGPSQECTSLEQARRAIFDRKFAKFVIRCQHCPAEPNRPEANLGLVRPIDKGMHLEPIRAANHAANEPESKPQATSADKKQAAPAPSPSANSRGNAVPNPDAEKIAALLKEREAALDKREESLKSIEAELKQREDELVEREEFVTRSEESLIDKIQQQERRAAELEQHEENIRRSREQLARREAEFTAKFSDSST